MGYVYLLCVAMMFSFGGTCVKLISPYFSAEFITFFRFLVGVFFLLVLKLIKGHKFRADFRQVFKTMFFWILFGAVAKWLAYLSENTALSQGMSYGNIVVMPMQTTCITLFSVFLFKDRMTKRQVGSMILCMAGVLMISWNGRPLGEFFGQNVIQMILFLCAGVCAAGHVLTQKMVADKMDIIDSNLLIFSISCVFAFLPLVPDIADGALTGVRPDLPCILAILAFGFITGIGFYLNAKAIPLVPFYMVPIIQSMMAIFAIIWGVLFFHESISAYVICGTLMFMVGLVGLQLKSRKGTKHD